MDGGESVAYGVASHGGQVLHFDEPLQRETWFDGFAGALRVADGVNVGPHFLDDAALFT